MITPALIAGTFVCVPPGVVHAYQFHSHYSQFMGPIAPAGWDRFFDFTGTPYAGPAYPQVDDSPPPFAKFGANGTEICALLPKIGSVIDDYLMATKNAAAVPA